MKYLFVIPALLANVAFARTFSYDCDSQQLGKFKVDYNEATFKSSIEIEGKSYKEARSIRSSGDLKVISDDKSFKIFIDEQITGIGTVSHNDTVGHVVCSRTIIP